jgi:putative glutamine transport system permease protein
MLELFQNVFTPSNVQFLAQGMGLTLLLSVIIIITSAQWLCEGRWP